MQISKKMRIDFRDAMKDHLVKSQITNIFDSADVVCNLDYLPPPNISGERRTLVEQYYATIQWESLVDIPKVLKAFGAFLSYLDEQSKNEARPSENRAALASTFRSLTGLANREGYAYADGKLSAAEASGHHLRGITEIAAKLDAKGLLTQAKRLESIRDGDPELSIGTAKEMIESACKIDRVTLNGAS